MVDCRTMLSALVAAYDGHRKWMMADKFAALQRAVEHARDVLAQPEPAPAADGEVALMAAWLRVTGELLNRRSDIQCRVDLRLFRRAALLLERQALRPIPVSERLPGPGDCDAKGRCWWYDMRVWRLVGPIGSSMAVLGCCFTYWLPAHALPLPEVE